MTNRQTTRDLEKGYWAIRMLPLEPAGERPFAMTIHGLRRGVSWGLVLVRNAQISLLQDGTSAPDDPPVTVTGSLRDGEYLSPNSREDGLYLVFLPAPMGVTLDTVGLAITSAPLTMPSTFDGIRLELTQGLKLSDESGDWTPSSLPYDVCTESAKLDEANEYLVVVGSRTVAEEVVAEPSPQLVEVKVANGAMLGIPDWENRGPGKQPTFQIDASVLAALVKQTIADGGVPWITVTEPGPNVHQMIVQPLADGVSVPLVFARSGLNGTLAWQGQVPRIVISVVE